jgi:hypothetical protein
MEQLPLARNAIPAEQKPVIAISIAQKPFAATE